MEEIFFQEAEITNKIDLLGISGSIRKSSFNLALLMNVRKLLPYNMHLSIRNLSDIPPYNDDLIPSSIPDAVIELRRAITDANAIIISCPEYNYSIPGVLKNALDWISTNSISNLMGGKIVALMGASRGRFGTVRAQLHLRQVLLAMNAEVINRPEIHVSNAGKLINPQGEFTDKKINDQILKLLSTLEEKILAN
jgi:chromate reductase